LKKNSDIERVISSEIYDVQIICTQIERKKGQIKFKDYYYRPDANYFYPSTAVALPAAVLTLEKLNTLAKDYEVDKFRNVRIEDPNAVRPIPVDTLNSFAEILRKMMTENDKTAFNNCYDFLDQQYFNETFHKLGYPRTWFLHKLNNKPPEDSRHTSSLIFFKTNIKSYFIDIMFLKRHPTIVPFLNVYVKKSAINPIDYYSVQPAVPAGKAHLKNDTLVHEPMNFAKMNKFPIKEMHEFLKMVIFPELHTRKPNLSDEDYKMLYQYMLANKKHILSDNQNPAIKIFNNSGMDMGFLIDNAYIVDTDKGTEMLMTIVVKCNRDDIFHANHHEYETVGLPFIKKASQIIYNHLVSRQSSDAVEKYKSMTEQQIAENR
jgi:hypothetical protein